MSTSTDGSDPVILATAGYDHAIRFWQAHSGICFRTVQHPDSVSLNRQYPIFVAPLFLFSFCRPVENEVDLKLKLKFN
jgi:hypothetical protein